MPKVSSKENKNIYFQRREELKLTRDLASELLESIPPERIENAVATGFVVAVRMALGASVRIYK